MSGQEQVAAGLAGEDRSRRSLDGHGRAEPECGSCGAGVPPASIIAGETPALQRRATSGQAGLQLGVLALIGWHIALEDDRRRPIDYSGGC